MEPKVIRQNKNTLSVYHISENVYKIAKFSIEFKFSNYFIF